MTIIGRSDTPSGVNARRAITRFAEIRFDAQAFGPANARNASADGIRAEFPLLDGDTATVNFRLSSRTERSASWTGQVENSRFGTATLAVYDDAVSAHLFLEDGRVFELAPVLEDGRVFELAPVLEDGRVFELAPDGSRLFWRQIDPAALQTEGNDTRIPPDEPEETPVPLSPLPPVGAPQPGIMASAPVRALDDGSQIDVLVVYTNAALAERGSAASMNALIAEAVAQANAAYASSGINTRLRLAGSQLVDYNYDTTAPGSDHLGRLTSPADGIIDNVHARRTAVAADLVSMIVSDSTCGIAYLKTNRSSTGRGYGFSVVSAGCSVNNFSFAHEIGHNLGANHDRANSSGNVMFPYAYGYQQSAETPYFRTIMAYPCASVHCPRVGHFANPGVNYQGKPTGIAQSSANAADVAATINQSRVWVARYHDSAAAATGPTGLHYVPTSPCRVLDTRNPSGSLGGPTLEPAVVRDFPVLSSSCGIPANAQAYSFNVTVVPHGTLGYITAWGKGIPRPNSSTLNAIDGRIKANAAIVAAGDDGDVSIFATDRTEVILDLNGYFVAENVNSAALAYYPMTPCRVADTRSTTILRAGERRSFGVREACSGVPSTAQAYSMNSTVVVPRTLGFLTLWPTGEALPNASTLNGDRGGILANAAILKAGAGGAISAYATDDTHLILDISGYFAPPGATGATRFFPLSPCRILDTRDPNGTFGGPPLEYIQARTWPATQNSICSWPTATPSAYVLNATAIPLAGAGLGYLKLWAAGQAEPNVSTMNAVGQPFDPIVANAAIVNSGTGGAIQGLSTDSIHLILDVMGYFLP